MGRDLFELEAEVAENVLRDERAGLSVLLARDDVPDVVEVRRDGGDLAAARLVPKGLQDETGAIGGACSTRQALCCGPLVVGTGAGAAGVNGC